MLLGKTYPMLHGKARGRQASTMLCEMIITSIGGLSARSFFNRQPSERVRIQAQGIIDLWLYATSRLAAMLTHTHCGQTLRTGDVHLVTESPCYQACRLL